MSVSTSIVKFGDKISGSHLEICISQVNKTNFSLYYKDSDEKESILKHFIVKINYLICHVFIKQVRVSYFSKWKRSVYNKYDVFTNCKSADPQYGMYLWPAAPVLAQYVWSKGRYLENKSVLEVRILILYFNSDYTK